MTQFWRSLRVSGQTPKLARNVARDKGHMAALRTLGWRVLVIWDCETEDEVRLRAHIEAFLE